MAGRHRSSRGGTGGRRDIYVRADLRPIYHDNKRRSISPVVIVGATLVVLAIAAGAYAWVRGGARGPAPTSAAGSAETSSTVATVTAPPLQPKVRPTVSVAAVGDICFMDSNHNSLGSAADLLAEMKPQLSAADLCLGNLEVALTSGGEAADKTYTFRAPLTDAQGLAQSGIDAVSIANNHALDYDRVKLPGELDALTQAGVTAVGGGLNKQEAWAVRTVERAGAKIGLLAFSEITPADFAATDTEPGVAYTQDSAAMAAAVSAAKASKQYDYLIVIMHWGVEGDYRSSDRQETEAHALIDAGADAVIGSHPHRIQGVEFYKGGLIAYSLGNFVFGTSALASNQSMLLNFQLTDSGVQAAEATPVYILRGKPLVATESDWDRIAAIIKSSSAHNGTTVTFSDAGVASFSATQ